MYRKFIVILGFLLLCQVSLASTCPRINDLKKSPLKDWKAYDSDDGRPLSPARLTRFKAHAYEFSLAEWINTDHALGSVHCYYRDKNGSNLEAYLAKTNLTPLNAKNMWYPVSGSMHCAAGIDKCTFQSLLLPPTQLAHRTQPHRPDF